jgi:hypothetical protein
VATLLGALFHFACGGDARRLALFLLVGWGSFVLGHLMGVNVGINMFNVGSLRFLPAIVVALIALHITRLLTVPRGRRRSAR